MDMLHILTRICDHKMADVALIKTCHANVCCCLITFASAGGSVRVHVPGARRRLRWCSALFALKRLEPVCCRVALCKRRFAQSASGRQRRVD